MKTTHASPLWSSPLKTRDDRLLPTHGARVCRWIEKHCVHGEGDWFGQPVKLRPWQKRWIYRLYEYYPETGRRRYRRALKGVPKGNGKTPEAAWIGAYQLLGGVHESPRVIIGAASLKQANWVFGDLRNTVTESPTLADLVVPMDLEIQLRDRPGVAERIAAEAGTNDGARATCFIADELHEWTGRKARIYLVVDGAITKRADAFVLGISTAGVRGESELLEDLYDRGKLVATGEDVDDSFLFEWYEAPPELSLDDEAEWELAVRSSNPAAGDFVTVESLRDRFSWMPRYEFERYHTNRWSTTARMWLPSGSWTDRAAPGRELEPGSEIAVGFDGSYNNDATALVGCTLDGYLFVIDAWEKPAHEADWIVPRDEVDGVVAKVFREFRVRRMLCDPPGWHDEIERWARTYGEDVVLHFPTANRTRMGDACSRFYTGVVTSELSHDNDPRLARHLDNAILVETADGAYIRKEGRSSPRKIDLAIAAILANEARSSMPDQAPNYLRTF